MVKLSTREIKFCICAGGIFFSYLLCRFCWLHHEMAAYVCLDGVFQEGVYKRQPDGERFESTRFLLTVQCAFNLVSALVASFLVGLFRPSPTPQKSAYLKPAAHFSFALIGFTYIGAMFCSNESIKV